MSVDLGSVFVVNVHFGLLYQSVKSDPNKILHFCNNLFQMGLRSPNVSESSRAEVFFQKKGNEFKECKNIKMQSFFSAKLIVQGCN